MSKGITYDDVAQAAENLLKEGQTPTMARVRQWLGNTGSNSTLSKYLNEWKHACYTRSDNESSKITPPDPVSRAVDDVWKKLREETNVEIKKIKEKAEEQIADAAAQLQHMQTQLNIEIENHHAKSAALAVSTQQVEKLSDDNMLKQQQIALLQKELTVTKENHQEKAHLFQNHLKELRDQQTLQANHFKSTLQDYKHMLENQRHEHMSQMDALKTEWQQSIKQLRDAEGEQRVLKANFLDLKQETEALLHEREELCNQLSKLNQSLEQAHQNLVNLRIEKQHSEQNIRTLTDDKHRLVTAHEKLSKEIRILRSRLFNNKRMMING